MKKSKNLTTKLDENGLIPNCLIHVQDWKIQQETKKAEFKHLFW